jgi:biotin carboxylase
MADESVFIGPSPSSESYLCGDKIIDACKITGADAVHPGTIPSQWQLISFASHFYNRRAN